MVANLKRKRKRKERVEKTTMKVNKIEEPRTEFRD